MAWDRRLLSHSSAEAMAFKEADLERNIDFFHHGLTCMVDPGQGLLIMRPNTTPDSVGDQLKRAAARIPVTGHILWPVVELETECQKWGWEVHWNAIPTRVNPPGKLRPENHPLLFVPVYP